MTTDQMPNPFETPSGLEAQIERIWKKCEVIVEDATSEASHNREQGSILLRWSITTCLTINVGALVATMNASEFDQNSRLWSGVWFLCGVLLSLIVSAVLASAFLKMASRKTALAKQTKLALKLRDLGKLEDLDSSEIRAGEGLGGVAFLLATLSVVAFIVGAAIMIDGAP